MADMDKGAILNLLQGMLGEEKAKEAGEFVQSFLEKPSENTNVPVMPSAPKDELFDTAMVMRELSGLMSRIQEAKNTKEAVLLSAIKPYLRASRQPKIDSCLKILQAYEVFHTMKKSGKLF